VSVSADVIAFVDGMGNAGLNGSSWTVHALELINVQLLDLAQKMILYQQKSIEIFQTQLRKTIRHEDGVQVAIDPDQ